MTGPYQRAIEHLARTYDDSPQYSGAFNLAVATFPAYLPTEIAGDVIKQRRLNAERVTPVTESERFTWMAGNVCEHGAPYPHQIAGTNEWCLRFSKPLVIKGAANRAQ